MANVIKRHKLASVAFQHLDSGKDPKSILDDMTLSRYINLIPSYQPEKLSDLFRRRNEETNS